MSKKKNRNKAKEELMQEIFSGKLSLNFLIQYIDLDCIIEDIPFEVVAEHYPELIWDWYPGFPLDLREITEDDPLLCNGKVEEGCLYIEDSGYLKGFNFEIESDFEGKCEVIVKKDLEGGHTLYLAPVFDEENEESLELSLFDSI